MMFLVAAGGTVDVVTAPTCRGCAMTTIDRRPPGRKVHFHDPAAPVATVVVPSVFIAVRGPRGRLLLVRRCDSGAWELPGGRVEVGEAAESTAVRETAEEAGVAVRVTGLVGLFTDPSHVVSSPSGEVRQQFVVVLRGEAVHGVPRGDHVETDAAAWVDDAELPGLFIEPPVRGWLAHALSTDGEPCLG
jgi:8-oxo-dGTP diphosphatase